jgi:hypothetical protein
MPDEIQSTASIYGDQSRKHVPALAVVDVPRKRGGLEEWLLGFAVFLGAEDGVAVVALRRHYGGATLITCCCWGPD